MQPLYSVDHETRHNTNREIDNEAPTTENTPLLQQRFPEIAAERSFKTTLIISLLLVILIAGVIIGIYLLVIQDESENILPPVDQPLQLVSRIQWDPSYTPQSAVPQAHNLKQVIVVQTGTNQCTSTESCTKLLRTLKGNGTAVNTSLPYNFLISSNGQAYEGLGWRGSSPLLIAPASGLVLAFIGNFTQVRPTPSQLKGAKMLIDESLSRQVLHPSYTIVSNDTQGTDSYLYQSLKQLPHSKVTTL